jgi:hypothetical protein
MANHPPTDGIVVSSPRKVKGPEQAVEGRWRRGIVTYLPLLAAAGLPSSLAGYLGND